MSRFSSWISSTGPIKGYPQPTRHTPSELAQACAFQSRPEVHTRYPQAPARSGIPDQIPTRNRARVEGTEATSTVARDAAPPAMINGATERAIAVNQGFSVVHHPPRTAQMTSATRVYQRVWRRKERHNTTFAKPSSRRGAMVRREIPLIPTTFSRRSQIPQSL